MFSELLLGTGRRPLCALSADPFRDGSLVGMNQFENTMQATIGVSNFSVAPSGYVGGKIGVSAYYNGSQTISGSTPSVNASGDFTLCVLVQPDAGGGRALWQCYDSGSAFLGAILEQSTPTQLAVGLYCKVNNGTTYYSGAIFLPVADSSAFVQMSIVVSGGLAHIYVDETHVTSVTRDAGTIGDKLYLGAQKTTTGQQSPFYGRIDHLLQFNRALTSEEVSRIYQAASVICSDPTPQDYIAYYPLTGTAEDKTGNYDGTENGGLLYVNEVVRGAVASFDGVNDYIDISSLPNILPANLNINWWYNGTGSQLTLAHRDQDTELYQVSVQNSKVTIQLRTSSIALLTITSVATLAANTWYNLNVHIKLDPVFGNYYSIYINGTLDSAASFTGSYAFAGSNVTLIGAYKPSSSLIVLPGSNKLSLLKLYARALTEAEIAAIYNYEKVVHPIPVDTDLIAYYPLAANSWDNYFNQYDGSDTGMVYDGLSGTFGTGANVNIDAYTANTILSTLDYSISFWMKATTISGTRSNGAVTFGGSTNGVGFGILKTTGKIGVGGTSADVNAKVAGTTTAVVGTWYHVTVSRVTSGGETKVYVDSILEATGTLSHGNGTDADRIGGDTVNNPMDGVASSNAIFFGNVAKVRIYHAILTQTQVTEIFDSEKGDFGL